MRDCPCVASVWTRSGLVYPRGFRPPARFSSCVIISSRCEQRVVLLTFGVCSPPNVAVPPPLSLVRLPVWVFGPEGFALGSINYGLER